MAETQDSFFVRHEFVIRRLHSLSGLIPIGLYMVVHLLVNASIVDGPAAYQKYVYQIHSLGVLLPFVEWTFIFLPIIFHAVVGILILMGYVPNTTSYPYMANWRYTLQRWTAWIALFFIAWHVFHMHGWFHNEYWQEHVLAPLGGAQFRAYNAGSSAGVALQSAVVAALYTIGMLACVYHFANGLWTMGITWGVWTSPRGQRRALAVCGAFGLLLAISGLGSIFGMRGVGHGKGLEEAIDIENRMYEFKIKSGEIEPTPHKRSPAQTEEVSR